MTTGVSNLAMTMTVNENLSAGKSVSGGVLMVNSSGALTGTPTRGVEIVFFSPNTQSVASSPQRAGPVPTDAVYWVAFVQNGDTIQHTGTITFSFWCAGGPGQIAQPCCPPDPLLQRLITQILAIDNQILGMFAPPLSGYVNNGTHGPFTTSGAFATTAGTIALDVSVLATGPAQGQRAGDPTRWFNLGWITPEVASVPYAATRLEFLQRTILLPALVDVINYTPGPGVTLQVTELAAAPAS